MDPPEAFDPPSIDKIDLEKLDPFLKELMHDHEGLIEQLNIFEKAIQYSGKVQKEKESKQTSLFGGNNGIDIPLPSIPERLNRNRRQVRCPPWLSCFHGFGREIATTPCPGV